LLKIPPAGTSVQQYAMPVHHKNINTKDTRTDNHFHYCLQLQRFWTDRS